MALRLAGKLARRSAIHGGLAALALLLPSAGYAAADAAVAARIDAGQVDTRLSENAALDQIFADETRQSFAADPMGALQQGQRVSVNEFLLLFTPELARQKRDATTALLARLQHIDPGKLDEPHRISRAVLIDAKSADAALLEPQDLALTEARPFNHFGGFHVAYPEVSSPGSGIVLETTGDYELLIARHRVLGRVFDQATARFREGLANGVTEPRLTVDNMIAQIDALLAQPVERSPFTSPARSFPGTVPTAERQRLRRTLFDVTRREVYPAYRKLRRFLADEYRPAAREQVGLDALPNGDRLYRDLIRAYTTLDLDPDTVHAMGLGEVARIQSDMERVKADLGFSGTLRAFFDDLRTNPRYHPKTEQQLADGFRSVGRKVDALAPRYFLHLPKTPLQIQPYPAYRAKFEAGGSYAQGAPDGSLPGTFFFNSYDLKSRFLTGVTTLYLHEGAPGHHFQISLAQENAELPDFQRFGGNNAYIEGWALYAETLGYEMGFYKDPMQHWGTLDDEMLRAMRLVVDTGLHAKGWSRSQAVDYMLANSGMGRSDAQAEVDRYIAIPGQALSYKIGALTIQRLRKEAENTLGRKFDIRAFHDQVLSSGALPMRVLESKVRGWISRTRAAR